jgi:hypothetical protein
MLNTLTSGIKLIRKSEAESLHSALQIGRADAAFFHEPNFLAQIAEAKFDIIRCKINADDKAAIIALENSGLYYNEANPILQYSMDFPYDYQRTFNHPEVSYILAKQSDKDEVHQIIAATMAEEPIGYFRVAYLDSLIHVEQEIAMLQTFYEGYLGSDDTKRLILLRRGEKCLGFITYDLLADQNMLYCPLAGILPEERSTGLFNDIGRYTFRYADELGFKHFMTGAREHNIKSRRAFEREGLKYQHRERLFHVMPMLSYLPTQPLNIQLQGSIAFIDGREYIIESSRCCHINGPFSANSNKQVLLKAADQSALISLFNYANECLTIRQYCCKPCD